MKSAPFVPWGAPRGLDEKLGAARRSLVAGGSVARYRFVTRWDIDAPVGRVWAEIDPPARWAAWWPGLEEVRPVAPGDAAGVGALDEFRFKSLLPYTLSFRGRVSKRVPGELIEIEAAGELDGTGRYELHPEEAGTAATLTWEVRTKKTWMNLLAPVAAPLFVWNHDRLMEAGTQGLGRKLGADVTLRESSRPSLAPSIATAVVVGAPLVWLALRRARRH